MGQVVAEYVWSIALDTALAEEGPTWVQIAKTGVQIPGTSLTTGPELYEHWVRTWRAMGKPGVVTLLHPSKRARPPQFGGLGETVPAADFRSLGRWLDVRATNDGFEVLVDWTPEGRQRVRAGEFTQASLEMPFEIRTSEGKFKNALTGFTLTNQPYIAGMRPVEADLVDTPGQNAQEDERMDKLIAQIREKLGVTGKDDAALLDALDSKLNGASELESKVATLEAEAKATKAEADAKGAGQSELMRRIVELEGKIASNAALDFYEDLARQGKATEATKASVIQWATTDMEAAKAYFDSAPVLVNLDDARGGVGGGHGRSGADNGHVRKNGTPREVALDASAEIDRKARERMAKDTNLSYEAACKAVWDEDRDLADAFQADIYRS